MDTGSYGQNMTGFGQGYGEMDGQKGNEKGKGKGKGKGGKGKGKKGGKGMRKGGGKGGGKSDLYFGKDDGDRIRPKVTENEAKEARAIVIKAQIDAEQRKAERETVKAQVVAASKDDLQAMINARLNKSLTS
mmetsp:Transcript_61803/g.135350  ORF Transcript_61803/g.135350 Transcript_61803/m.135350 type:complete len:132 (-) Transcript_61803:158-553(-)